MPGPPRRVLIFLIDGFGLRSHGSSHAQAIPIVLAGAGILPRTRITDARIVDLAPTLSRLLGLDGGGFQGRVLEEALA